MPATRPVLGRRLRTVVVVAHVVSAAAWLGIDVMVAVLVATGLWSADAPTRAVALQALGSLAGTPMLVAAVATLATGVALGLGTRWGLVRYWWVLVKAVMTVAMVVLVALVLRPGLTEVAAAGGALARGEQAAIDLDWLVFPPAVSLTALTAAVVLSVAKPWGRVRSPESSRHPIGPRRSPSLGGSASV